jgi:glycerate 2-kinase
MSNASLARDLIRRWYTTALSAVEPRAAVRRILRRDEETLTVGHEAIALRQGRIIVLAIGKAAVGMAQGAVDSLDDGIDSGVVLTKYGHVSGLVQGFEVFEAGHPVPDDAGMTATGRILGTVSGLAQNDLVFALISGGGSALLELPRKCVTLDDMRATTRLLMHAGAGIHDLNAVRTALSQVKGGGLRHAIGPARCITILLSDVLGNDPSVIASGPTVAPAVGTGSPLDVVARFGIGSKLPPSVMSALQEDRQRVRMPDTCGDIVVVAADNATFVRATAAAAADAGLSVVCDMQPFDGNARELGRAFVQAARDAPDDVDVIVRGGEATVEVTGSGIGGRNTEMALAAALEMTGDTEWVIGSLASDGDDGNSGAAGAIADGDTVSRALAMRIDPAAALENNDSATLFRTVGGCVLTGPTGTNVNDFYVAVRRRAVERWKE